jgi:DNA repair exonuclease SbcCD ATPase subunit
MFKGIEGNGLSEKLMKLHVNYGFNVRFEGGNEGDDDDAVNKAIKDAEDAELNNNPEFNKFQQQADQHKANAERAKERAEQAENAVEAAQAENENLKQQLEEAQAAARAAGIKDVELNPDDYTGEDRKLVEAVLANKEQLKAKDEEIKSLKNKAEAYDATKAKEEQINAQNAAYEEVLSALDEEHGANCRNEAIAMYNELRDQGKTPKGNPAKAALVMADCYKKVKAKLEKDGKTKIPKDNHSGGGGKPNFKGAEIKEGSLDEVAAQFQKAGATQEFKGF